MQELIDEKPPDSTFLGLRIKLGAVDEQMTTHDPGDCPDVI